MEYCGDPKVLNYKMQVTTAHTPTFFNITYMDYKRNIVVENGLLGTATKLQTSLLHHESCTQNTAGHRTSTPSCNSLVGEVHA